MRRFMDWLGGALGGVALYRLLSRRSPEPSAPGVVEADARADELRAKLVEVRASDTPSPVEPGEPEESVEERRRRVYEEGRSAIDEMQGE
jgi:hypothetical protein